MASQMVVRDALNSAIDEEMAADPKVFVIGEEVMSFHDGAGLYGEGLHLPINSRSYRYRHLEESELMLHSGQENDCQPSRWML